MEERSTAVDGVGRTISSRLREKLIVRASWNGS